MRLCGRYNRLIGQLVAALKGDGTMDRKLLHAIAAVSAAVLVATSVALAHVAIGLTAPGSTGQVLCVSSQGQSPVMGPTPSGQCKSGQTSVTVSTESEVTALQAQVSALQGQVSALQTTLSKVSYNPQGLNGQPTLTITGANLQVVSGSGTTDGPVNGLGNLILGYDEGAGSQTGSHNLVLGKGQTFTSYGAVIGGRNNNATGPFEALFGSANVASGDSSAVTGGRGNTASNWAASVSGGIANTASAEGSSVSGGRYDVASDVYASVSGGYGNTANYASAAVSGGEFNTASNYGASVTGGTHNLATGDDAAVTGGYGNTASGDHSAVLGGNGVTSSTVDGTSP
jgi:hypothetical protein